ncbi:MAG: hypothetical protein Q9220_001555 [cf. Caloplaca sp. 1 TL-2023]
MPSTRLHPTRCLRQIQIHNAKNKPTRSFTTTTSNQLPSIGPESPNFIHVPRPPQPDAPHRPHIKGILPKPRKIFPRGSPDKTSPSYLAAVTPEPQSAPPVPPPNTPASVLAHIDHKRALASHRRRNLRESLHELHARKQKLDLRASSRSEAKQRLRSTLLSAPVPPEEQHTAPSTLVSSLPKKGNNHLPDPNRSTRLATKSANHTRHTTAKALDRRNALHTLYMNARSFIVTEDKLTEAVENAFDPNNEQFDNESRRGLNVWNLGYTETVKEMLDRANKEGGEGARAVERYGGFQGVTGGRMRRLGEELTGGKM